MQTYIECIPCLIRQALDSIRIITNDASTQDQLLRKALMLVAGVDTFRSPPEIAQDIYRLLRVETGIKDPYFEIKKRSNLIAMHLFEKIKNHKEMPKDEFEAALRLAIAGNIIDFGVKGNITDEEIIHSIHTSLTADINREAIITLKDRIRNCKRLLYLADNAGEIVFDKFLIQQLPQEKTIVAVRGKPIINDATIEDAKFASITDIVRVIDNGSDAPGTVLKNCSEEFNNIFSNADLIIAKGQGNFETLNDVSKDIFFLFKVKCPVVSEKVIKPIGTLMITNPFSGV